MRGENHVVCFFLFWWRDWSVEGVEIVEGFGVEGRGDLLAFEFHGVVEDGEGGFVEEVVGAFWVQGAGHFFGDLVGFDEGVVRQGLGCLG